MNRKIVKSMFLLLMFSLLVGCSGNKQENKEITSSKKVNDILIEKMNIPEKFEVLATQWSEVSGAYFGEDIYVKTNGEYVEYEDYETKETMYACSRVNCNHDTKECQAYFFAIRFACICDNKLIVFAIDENKDNVMYGYRCNIDGSDREIICKLEGGMFSVSDGLVANNQIYLCVHNNYFVEMDEDKHTQEEIIYDGVREQNTIYGIEVSTGEVKKIIEFPAMSRAIVSKMLYREGYLFVEHYYSKNSLLTLKDYVSEDLESFVEIEKAFFAKYTMEDYYEVIGQGCDDYIYELSTGNLKKIEEDFSEVVVLKFDKNNVFVTGTVNEKDGIYKIDIAKKERTMLFEGYEGTDCCIDGTIIRVDNENKCHTYNEVKNTFEEKSGVFTLACMDYIAENTQYVMYQDEEEVLQIISKQEFWGNK